ncbi:CRISPR-associated endonuclease Cas2, partial [Cylindrospermopsis raciborskii]
NVNQGGETIAPDIVYPESDGKPMADNTEQFKWIVKILEGYGDRVQYSIFRSWLTMRSREKLRWELERILTDEDSLLLIRLSNQCVNDIRKYNRPNAWLLPDQCYKIF